MGKREKHLDVIVTSVSRFAPQSVVTPITQAPFALFRLRHSAWSFISKSRVISNKDPFLFKALIVCGTSDILLLRLLSNLFSDLTSLSNKTLLHKCSANS